MAKQTDNKVLTLITFSVIVFLTGVIMIFLFSKGDSYGQYSPITGIEAVNRLGKGFWLGVIGGIAGGAVLWYIGWSNYTGGGPLGPKLRGKMGVTILCFALAILAVIWPWVGAFEKKANAGVYIEWEKVIQLAKEKGWSEESLVIMDTTEFKKIHLNK